MKTIRRLALVLSLALAASIPVCSFTGCITKPAAQAIEVRTLLAVGQSAEAAVGLSAQLYRDGKITAAQARDVIDFFDNKFQPVFRLAAATAKADLSTLASPDLAALATQLVNLVNQLSK
jgi:hypothetical protein